MITIRILKTGEIKEVYKNDAHALIEAGEAELIKKDQGYQTKPFFAKNKLKRSYVTK